MSVNGGAGVIPGGGSGGSGAVNSVRNTDQTITSSPTTGSVVVSLGPAPAAATNYYNSITFR